MAKVVNETLERYNISKEIWAIAMDNCTTNDKLVKILEKYLKGHFCGTESQIRCFCHILNLMMQAALIPYKKKNREKEDPSQDEDYDYIPSDDEGAEDIARPESSCMLEEEDLISEDDKRYTGISEEYSAEQQSDINMVTEILYKVM